MNSFEVFKLAGEEHEAFLRAIGELTLAWSDLEVVLYKLLKHYAGVNDAVGLIFNTTGNLNEDLQNPLLTTSLTVYVPAAV